MEYATGALVLQGRASVLQVVSMTAWLVWAAPLQPVCAPLLQPWQEMWVQGQRV
jgi:hypothetical protein